jgi:hypothetical protein
MDGELDMSTKTPEQIARETLIQTASFPLNPTGADLRALMVRAVEADRTQRNATTVAVRKDLAARILSQLDGFMERTLTLHDIGKAIPHPYDAIGAYASSLAHDFANTAFGIRKFIETEDKL